MEPIYKLMNKIYEQKKTLENWKMSRIVPLHKKGLKTKVENYGPMEMANSPAYADDSFHYGVSKTKQQALEILQVKLKAAIEWIRGSGLKVNLEKTEMCVFHKMDTSKGAFGVGNIRVESSQQLR